MTVARLIKKGSLGLTLAVLFAGGVGVVPAHALSPWWHLSTSSRPTYLQPGLAKDEIQQLTVSATEGRYLVETPVARPILEVGEPPAEVQAALEEGYGAGNVQVTGGPGSGGTNPYEVYEITFAGALAFQKVELMKVPVKNLTRGEEEGEALVTRLSAGRPDGVIAVTAMNLGDENVNPTVQPVTVTDLLPVGLKAIGIEGAEDEQIGSAGREYNQLECTLGSLTCIFTGVNDINKMIPPYERLEMRIAVNVAGAKTGEVNRASIAGGGVLGATANLPLTVSGGSIPFGLNTYEMRPEEVGGSVATQAGSHPFQLTTTVRFNETFKESPLAGEPVQQAKDLHFNLPPGLIGNPTPFPQCTLAQFLRETTIGNECPPQTAIGVAMVRVNVPGALGGEVANIAVPLFNLEPAAGEPARFGFLPEHVPVLLDTAVRTGTDYAVRVNVTNITQAAGFIESEVTFWGVPGDPSHDNQRGWTCLGIETQAERESQGCQPLGALHSPPFLSLPTSCSGPLKTTVEQDSWAEPHVSQSLSNTLTMPAMDGCNRLQFNPSITVAPDGQAGSTPSGLSVAEHVPQDPSLNPQGLAEAHVKDTTVALPVGIGLNPAAADGLSSCSEAQVSLDTPGPSACADASKVGLVRIKTPLLPNELEGAAYLATQNANPFGSLVALYVVAEDPVSGTRVKVAGEVVPDPVTGQLVSSFKNTPQLPFETFELHFFGGDRAPLSTPSLCGAYTTIASIAPWSGNEPANSSSTFNVTSGPNGIPCHDPLPFSPSLTAGTTSIQAGGFSPFTMTMSRPDGSQNLQAIKLTMPPGMLGTLATVKLCKEAQANAGTCGPESLIGHTTVSVGVGGDPYTVTGGEVFITEGYGGAPYGLSIVNPAKAGPFDLGKVIVRAKIEVDPLTAALTITTDNSGPYKIPTILDGIPLQIQHVEVSVDRPDFTFNPTNCSPLQVGGSLYSSEGSSAAVKVPFQITNCAVLAFKPKLTAKTAGKTSRKAGASLSVKLTYPAGPYDANIARVKVDLPKQLPSRLTTLQKACPAATFEANPAACPSASIVGHATATTPVLPVPLTGPAYFVSHAGEEFPSLIIVLQGYGATVHLVGTTFIDNKTNITSSTFKAIPDVPVGTFELTLPQGPYSALAATTNLCSSKLAMPTAFVAQNGVEIHTSTPIAPTGCAKHKTAKKTRDKKASRKGTTHKKKK